LFFIPDVKYYIAVLFVFLDFFVSCFTSIWDCHSIRL
jgi:hypothetical protein